jgi:hypothetical protein
VSWWDRLPGGRHSVGLLICLGIGAASGVSGFGGLSLWQGGAIGLIGFGVSEVFLLAESSYRRARGISKTKRRYEWRIGPWTRLLTLGAWAAVVYLAGEAIDANGFVIFGAILAIVPLMMAIDRYLKGRDRAYQWHLRPVTRALIVAAWTVLILFIAGATRSAGLALLAVVPLLPAMVAIDLYVKGGGYEWHLRPVTRSLIVAAWAVVILLIAGATSSAGLALLAVVPLLPVIVGIDRYVKTRRKDTPPPAR